MKEYLALSSRVQEAAAKLATIGDSDQLGKDNDE